MKETKTILAFQPIKFDGSERFLRTNLGALVEALESMGWRAKQVLIRPDEPVNTPSSVILVTKAEACSPEWWKKQNPWAVIFNTWAAPRFKPYWDAARAATPRLAERLDSDGNRSPRVDLPLYLYSMWAREINENRGIRQLRSLITPLLHATLHTLFPRLLDARIARALTSFAFTGAESPIAVHRLKRFVSSFGHSSEMIQCSPFPIPESDLPPMTPIPSKHPRVISVGRWESFQKNFPLLLKTLNGFLAARKDWDAVIVGSLPDNCNKLIQKHCEAVSERIKVIGPRPHFEICRLLTDSRIFLMSSRGETFGIAAAEALCCGCSVVGPPHIASIPYFCGERSGTVATLYTRNSLQDALNVEADAWEALQRNPEQIMALWRERVGAVPVARTMMDQLANV